MGGKLPPYAVAESDNSPVVYQPWKIIFPNGTLTDVGDGTVFVGIGTSISTTTSIEVSSYDVRTPILVAGTVLFFLTDGTVTKFLNGAGYYSVPSQLAYAPSGAYYIIQSNPTNLPNAIELATKLGGLIKNTSATGVITIASGGVDFENILVAASPLLKSFSTLSILTDGSTTSYLRGDGTWRKVYEARSPIISSGTVLSLSTDGLTTTYLRGDGTWRTVYEARSPIISAGTVLSLSTDGGTTTYLRGDGSWRSVYEARSPIISSGTILSIVTDGTTTNFFRGDGSYAVPSSNSGIKVMTFTVYSSASWTGETVSLGVAPYETPITIKQVDVFASGSSPTVAFNIDHRAWGTIATAGTNLFASNKTATTAGFETTTFTSSTIAAKAHIVLTTSAVTIGQADYISGSIYYSRNSI